MQAEAKQRGRRLAALGAALAGALVALGLVACSGGQAHAPVPSVRVAGASDVVPLVEGLSDELHLATKLALVPLTSTTSLADLKAGRADAALVGRELSADELQGLDDHIIAYDAVCLLINARTFAGGVEQQGTAPIQLRSKYGGLPGLTLEDVKGYMANLLRRPDSAWQLHGPTAGFFTFQVYQDVNGQTQIDPDQPDRLLGMWVWNDVALGGELLPPGKFDTQAALLQKLGFPASDLARPGVGFVPSILDNEEELVSFRFKIDPDAATPISWRPFDFYVGAVSRRITLRALEYGFDVHVLPIDGVDPLTDPSVIYSGAYPFSRKIHLLTRQPAPASAQALVTFLLSPAGQLLIARANYLPLPPVGSGS